MLRANLFALVLLLGLSGQVLGQVRPETTDLENSFREFVPQGWELTEFVPEVQENYGTEVEPDVRTRFQAVVQLSQDTYEFAGELTGAILLRPLLQAGELRTYYGVARSRRSLGSWETEFMLENNPTQGTGDVLDAFPGRRLVLGSTDEAEYRAVLQAEADTALAEELARLAREERVREQERASELAEIAHANNLQEAEARAAHEAELARAAQEQALAAARREQEAADRAAREAEMAARAEELQQQLAAELRVLLAPHWQISRVDEVGLTRGGIFDEPVFTMAFRAELKLLEGTYTAREVEGGGLVLDPLQAEGAVQNLAGTATASWSAGTWQLQIEFNNMAGFSAGLPRDHYPATAVITGSSEEAAYWRAVEQAAEDELARELTALARQEQLKAAQYEAVRTAAAQAARLEAIELAARAAELAAVQASLLEAADQTIQLAALERAVESADENIYWLALEAALSSQHDLVLSRAITLALTSGNGRLTDLALVRSLFNGGGVRLTSNSRTVLMSELTRHGDGTVSAQFSSNSSDVNCGAVSGTLRNGSLSLANERCNVLITVPDANTLNVQFITSNSSRSVAGPFPGASGAE